MDNRSNDGKETGKIEFLRIDGVSAKVHYVLIKEDGELELEDDELVPLPF